jgi:hypothetical protein
MPVSHFFKYCREEIVILFFNFEDLLDHKGGCNIPFLLGLVDNLLTENDELSDSSIKRIVFMIIPLRLQTNEHPPPGPSADALTLKLSSL